MLGRRICVVGNSGSGKTRLARRFAEALDVPHVELDSLYHRPNWQVAERSEFVADVARRIDAAEADRGGWVADGNYLNNLGRTLFQRADTVVWLDYARGRVFLRLLRRTAGRLLLRRRLWHDNRERWSAVVNRDPAVNILLWSWTRHKEVRHSLAAECDDRWLRLRRPREADRLLAHLSR